MNRYLITLFLTLVASLFAVSCANEMELSEPLFGDDEITLVPRVHSFSNKYVTKADAGDAAVKSMTVFVYDGNGQCVYTKDVGNVTSFTLNKSLLAGNTGMNNASVVLVANAKIADFKTNTNSQWTSIGDKPTLAKFEASSYVYTDATAVLTALPEAGLPMVGITEGVDLTPTSTEAVEIPLKILYAKVNFTVDVVDGGENQNTVEGGMTFTFDETASYTIHNVATVTPLSEMPDYSANAHVFTGDSKKAVDLSGSRSTSLAGNDAVSFTFYMAETRYTPTTSLGSVYPSSWDATDNYAAYNHLKQQFKPVLATTATGYPTTGLATYVTLNGTYKDYRGKDWSVSYKIYLGKDNYANFQVDRNSEYTNLISIKGIRNTVDNGTEVWIDHRVNVEGTTSTVSDHVKITRETLLDSHFEVRPLRVQWEEGKYTGVRLYLPTDKSDNLLSWIGVERFAKDGSTCQDPRIYCYQGESSKSSTGKRRYFSQHLLKELQKPFSENKYIDLSNGDCAWIYFDENVTPSDGKYTDREATITLEFMLTNPKTVDGNTITSEVVEYKVKQNGLASVTLGEGTSAKTYQFESYEEYLHSYDATDTYSLSTSPIDYTQQGLKWGYKDTTLSHKEFVSATQVPNLGLADLKDVLSQRYDYFHPSDDPDNTYHIYVENNGSWTKNDAWKTGRSGLYFTDKAMHDRMETVIDMGTAPKNAYQYCLSKNKFEVTASGDVNMKIHWYLPDAYQLQDILANPTEGLSSEAYYWSSQPSFTGREYNILTKISFKAEDAANARAVKSKVGEEPLDRSERHRIRCLYSKDGVVAQDMNKRIPDGIAIDYSFDMKAWANWEEQKPGYFSQLPTRKQGVKFPVPYKLPDTYAFPKVAADAEPQVFNETIQYEDQYGFNFNPTDETKWKTERVGVRESQTTLGQWPGLTTSNVVAQKNTVGNTYYTTEGEKEDTMSEKVAEATTYSEDIFQETLPRLDGDMLEISFNAGDNTKGKPKYEYYKEHSSVTHEYKRTWSIPEYSSRDKTGYKKHSEHTSAGTVQLTSEEKRRYNDPSRYVQNSDGYIYATENDAMTAGNARKEELENQGAINIVVTPSSATVTIYNASIIGAIKKKRYRYEITCELPDENSKVTYYYHSSGGEWKQERTTPENPDPVITEDTEAPTTDQLCIYTGNSFTITCTDPNYKIVGVKVHYSGNTLLTTRTEEVGTFTDQVEYNARFVASQITLPSSTVAEMDYEIGDGKGTQQWRGNGRDAVTLVLANYVGRKNQIDVAGSYSYTYANAHSDFYDKYLVIDKIEVKLIQIPSDN